MNLQADPNQKRVALEALESCPLPQGVWRWLPRLSWPPRHLPATQSLQEAQIQQHRVKTGATLRVLTNSRSKIKIVIFVLFLTNMLFSASSAAAAASPSANQSSWVQFWICKLERLRTALVLAPGILGLN